jgi:hypothetical protein
MSVQLPVFDEKECIDTGIVKEVFCEYERDVASRFTPSRGAVCTELSPSSVIPGLYTLHFGQEKRIRDCITENNDQLNKLRLAKLLTYGLCLLRVKEVTERHVVRTTIYYQFVVEVWLTPRIFDPPNDEDGQIGMLWRHLFWPDQLTSRSKTLEEKRETMTQLYNTDKTTPVYNRNLSDMMVPDVMQMGKKITLNGVQRTAVCLMRQNESKSGDHLKYDITKASEPNGIGSMVKVVYCAGDKSLFYDLSQDRFYAKLPVRSIPPGRGILKLTVGRGKTLAMLALIQISRPNLVDSLLRQWESHALDYVPTTLICVPTNLMKGWVREITNNTDLKYEIMDKWNPIEMLPHLQYGVTRKSMQTPNLVKLLQRKNPLDILLVSHEYIQKIIDSFPVFENICFCRIIVDEIHEAKNMDTVLSRAICKVKALYKWGMTATPVPNKFKEMGAYCRFLDIPYYNTSYAWKGTQLKNIKSSRAIKDEFDVIINRFYSSMPRKLPTELISSDNLNNIPTLIREYTLKPRDDRVFQIAIDPTDNYAQYYKRLLVDGKKPSKFSFAESLALMNYEGSTENDMKHSKMYVLLEILRLIRATEATETDNIIITSRFKEVLRKIYKTLENDVKFKNGVMKGWTNDNIDPVSTDEREEWSAKMQDRSKILVVSGDIIKQGLNMEYANHMFIIEPDWHYDGFLQKAGRTQRETQTRNTYTYVIYVKGTEEEKTLLNQIEKLEQRIKSNMN